MSSGSPTSRSRGPSSSARSLYQTTARRSSSGHSSGRLRARDVKGPALGSQRCQAALLPRAALPRWSSRPSSCGQPFLMNRWQPGAPPRGGGRRSAEVPHRDDRVGGAPTLPKPSGEKHRHDGVNAGVHKIVQIAPRGSGAGSTRAIVCRLSVTDSRGSAEVSSRS